MKYLACCLLLFFTLNLNAQDKITNGESGLLSDIKNLELTSYNGGMTGYYTRVNIFSKNSKWYAKRRKIDLSEKDSIVTDSLTREVAADSIMLLIDNLLKPNPVIKVSLFNLDRDTLIKYYHASQIASKLITEQKFIRRIDDSTFMQRSLTSLYYPRFRMDHESTFKIIVRFNKGSTLIAVSLSGTSPYNLPWKLNGIKNYNPDISRAFYYLFGKPELELNRRIWLYRNLVDQLGKPALEN